MASRSTRLLRIAVVQFAPKMGEVHANIAKARELCRGLTPRSVDVVCFPEMIFTGYTFPDARSIAPYLEHPKTGPTASFCRELAARVGCVVVAGYPERLVSPGEGEGEGEAQDDADPYTPTPPPAANAALLCDPTGHLLHTYHKSNLFPTDRTWSLPGPGFTSLVLPAPLGRTALAICNDLNVRAGTVWADLERGPYELGTWCVEAGVKVVVLVNAWLKPGDGGMEGIGERAGDVRDGGGGDVDGNGGDGDGLEPNWEVLNYWAMRLRPLWAPLNNTDRRDEADADAGTGADADADGDATRDVIVVVCNRCGRERGKTFVGSSAMFSMRRGSGRPRLLHWMGEREQGLRIWTAEV